MSDFYAHDPDAGPLDYSIDFTNWLSEGDGVSSISWSSYPTGLTLENASETDDIASIQITGGTLGYRYRVTAHVTTDNGIENDRSIILMVGQS